VVRRPVRQRGKTIGFIASDYLPNRDAIEHFVARVWPEMPVELDCKLSIYGSVAGALPSDLGHGDHRIELRGFAADLGAVYDEIDIAINPVRFGAGLKIKNVEAMANARPLVTTEHGARGLERGTGRAFLVAEGPRSFARHLRRLLEAPEEREKMSQRALAFVDRHFSIDRCYEPLARLLGAQRAR
jgi:glycosyltransferase involved in cell wall biosynthesis